MIFSQKSKNKKDVSLYKKEEKNYNYFVKPLYSIIKRIYLLSPQEREKKLKFFLKRLEILSEIIDGKVISEFKEINPKEFIQEVISEIKNFEDLTSIDLEILLEEDFKFISSPSILKFILIEILKNSIWACKNQGKISICFKQDNYNVYIEIKDNGIGIPKEIKDDIFLPLTQFHERFYKGFGLGLSMVKELSRFMACNVEFESYFPEGAIFRLIIPKKIKVKGNL
jgi:signal transduction histidine kinase